MRLAIPDLISNSYFTALAAAELGHFAHHGLKVEAELIFPVDRATLVGEKRFPPRETKLIAGIVEYDAAITEKSIAGVTGFSKALGILDRNVAYADIVATRFSDLWNPA